jgi:hypothetical protein
MKNEKWRLFLQYCYKIVNGWPGKTEIMVICKKALFNKVYNTKKLDKFSTNNIFVEGHVLKSIFQEMDAIFDRTKQALLEFMEIITPIINDAKDNHERLYWHHIYEEEDHRSDRLDILLPKIKEIIDSEWDFSEKLGDFLHLLQDIRIEKFGLHNFLEHLDLSLFHFKGTEYEGRIQALRDFTYHDYQRMKGLLEELNEEFKDGIGLDASIPTDEKEGRGDHVKIAEYMDNHVHDHHHSVQYVQTPKYAFKRTLTVGSLKQRYET